MPIMDTEGPRQLLEEARLLAASCGEWAVTGAGTMAKLQVVQDRWCELAYEQLGPLCGMPGKPCQAFEIRKVPLKELFADKLRPMCQPASEILGCLASRCMEVQAKWFRH